MRENPMKDMTAEKFASMSNEEMERLKEEVKAYLDEFLPSPEGQKMLRELEVELEQISIEHDGLDRLPPEIWHQRYR